MNETNLTFLCHFIVKKLFREVRPFSRNIFSLLYDLFHVKFRITVIARQNTGARSCQVSHCVNLFSLEIAESRISRGGKLRAHAAAAWHAYR